MFVANCFIIITNVVTGHPTDGMYFIEHGKVETRLPEGEIIEKITEGGYFGGNSWCNVITFII